MTFVTCEKSKQKHRIARDVCYRLGCPHLKISELTNILACHFQPKDQKLIERKKQWRKRSR